MSSEPDTVAGRWAPSEAEILAALAAYREGAFPMAVSAAEGGRPDFGWFQADPRAVLALDRFHVPRSLRTRIRSGRFEVSSDRAFARVLRACQTVPRRDPSDGLDEGSWISDDYRALLGELHRCGYAHSVEAWLPDQGDRRLVGGVYGVALGGVFCAESMFSLPGAGGSDASKVCLAHLVAHLRRRRFLLLDAQILNPFTERLGVQEIPLAVYLQLLQAQRDEILPWHPEELSRHAGPEVLETLSTAR